MHFYGMSYQETMDMPVKAFWRLNEQVRRVMSEKDMRLLSVMIHSQSAEAAKEYRGYLQQEMGEITVKEEGFDRAGYDELKRLAAGCG